VSGASVVDVNTYRAARRAAVALRERLALFPLVADVRVIIDDSGRVVLTVLLRGLAKDVVREVVPKKLHGVRVHVRPA
jgi:hypothetical protein